MPVGLQEFLDARIGNLCLLPNHTSAQCGKTHFYNIPAVVDATRGLVTVTKRVKVMKSAPASDSAAKKPGDDNGDAEEEEQVGEIL